MPGVIEDCAKGGPAEKSDWEDEIKTGGWHLGRGDATALPGYLFLIIP
jgi:hypothetical protein